MTINIKNEIRQGNETESRQPSPIFMKGTQNLQQRCFLLESIVKLKMRMAPAGLLPCVGGERSERNSRAAVHLFLLPRLEIKTAVYI